MQEIKKRRIVLASLLKPVDDSRMYEKLGLTLASTYGVTVVGRMARTESANHVGIVPLPAHGRLSYKRLLAPWHVLRATHRIRPDILIICSAELLPIALCARLLWGVKIVYDIQENYARNIIQGDAWPRLLRPLLALAVRTVEYLTSPAVSHYLLAEQSYKNELKFVQEKFTIVENKLVRPHEAHKRSACGMPAAEAGKTISILFSGTLAETTGVFTAISLAQSLNSEGTNIRLTIVGYAAQDEVRNKLKKLAMNDNFIDLVGIDRLVPHSEILKAIREADFGVVAYPENPSTWHTYPTKLYEYMGHLLPILLIDNPKWTTYCAPYRAAVVFPRDLSFADITALSNEMREGRFYPTTPENVFWEAEAPKLLKALESVSS